MSDFVRWTGRPSPRSADILDELDLLVPDLLQQHAVAGLTVAIINDGGVVGTRTYGLADVAANRPVTGSTLFQVASLAKPVTAWGVMRLAARGAVDLDAPVERYLTRWHLPPTYYDTDEVTIRRILSHTAGLSMQSCAGVEPDRPVPSLEDFLSGVSGPEDGVFIAQQPGSGFRYSGGGYTILQLLIEEVTQQPFAAYMAEQILALLGMLDSSFERTPARQKRTATPYLLPAKPLPDYRYTSLAAAELYTTAADFAQFVAATMPGPQGEPPGRGVLSPETVAMMISPVPEAQGNYGNFGLGYVLGPGGMIGHWGGGGIGWRAMFAAQPQRREGIVIFSNSERGEQLSDELF